MDEEINTLFSIEKFTEIIQISNKLPLASLKPKTINQIGIARFKLGKYPAGIEAFKNAAYLDDQYAENYLRALEKGERVNELCAGTVSCFSNPTKINVCYWIIERHKKFDANSLKNLVETSLMEESFYVLQRLLIEEKVNLASVLMENINLAKISNISRVLSIFRAIGHSNLIEKVLELPTTFTLIESQLKLIGMALEEKYHDFVAYFNEKREIHMRCPVLQEYLMKSLGVVDRNGLFKKLLESDEIDQTVKAAFLKFSGEKQSSIEKLKLVLEGESDNIARNTIIYNLAEQGYYHGSLSEVNDERMGTNISRVILLNAVARYRYHLEDFEGSFKAIKASNDLHQNLIDETVDYERVVSSYQELISLSAAVPCNNNYSPVFIVGSPRCGSSLLAAKLCSNSGFAPLGESNLVRIGLRQLEIGRSYQEVADFITERFKQNANGKTPVIKLLENIFYVPLILHLFPTAKIIYLSRDRKDTAWSIFENFFITRWMLYATSIEKIERHLNAVEEANNLWQRLEHQNYLPISYNDLSTRTTETLDILSEFLGRTVKNKKVSEQLIYTASASQVRLDVKLQAGKWLNLYEYFDKDFKATWSRL